MAHTKKVFEEIRITEDTPFRDGRGTFVQAWRKDRLPIEFVCTNVSYNKPYVLRGLHYQAGKPQGKLVTCLVGRIYDVAVDMRRSSRDFGNWMGIWLDAESQPRRQIYIPPGFAHGFIAGEKGAIVMYQVTEQHDAAGDRVLAWDDPDLRIDWPLEFLPPSALSAKDARGTLFRDSDGYP